MTRSLAQTVTWANFVLVVRIDRKLARFAAHRVRDRDRRAARLEAAAFLVHVRNVLQRRRITAKDFLLSFRHEAREKRY
jgi:hypothetical protein